MEKRVLGKGLSALIPAKSVAFEVSASADTPVAGNVFYIPVKDIKTNRYQPRVEFNKERLDELAGSIRKASCSRSWSVRSPMGTN